MASIDAQGTELFLSLDGTTVSAFPCPTAITGVGWSSDLRETSCLDQLVSSQKPGRKRLNAISVPFRVQAGSAVHQDILDLSDPTTPLVDIPYAVAWSDGTDDPTLTAGAFVAPGGATPTRTIQHGTAYITQVSIDFNDGEDVTGTFQFAPQTLTNVWKDD